MMTFVELFASRLFTTKYRSKITFYWQNLSTSIAISTLKSINKFRKYIQGILYLTSFLKEIWFIFVALSECINVCI